jgi:shikimate kinase
VSQIIIAGFMGTGKTEVGRRLARALGRPFVDTDRLVETRAGRRVHEIFAAEGEARFRALEREAVAEACGIPDAVVSTGGGAVVDPENRRRLAAAGPIVCLTATPEAILARVGDPKTRPLLAGCASRAERLARIRELLAARETAYGSATHVVDTTGLTADQVAARVRDLVEAR